MPVMKRKLKPQGNQVVVLVDKIRNLSQVMVDGHLILRAPDLASTYYIHFLSLLATSVAGALPQNS